MVVHFEISTSFILERLKDLETDSFGNRPQTAAVLSKIGNLATLTALREWWWR